MTPSVISYWALPFSYPCGTRSGPPIDLAGVHLSQIVTVIRVHYQIIIINAVLYLSNFLFLIKMNCNAGPTSFFPWTFNNIGMHVLSFGSKFKMLSCFVLGKCSVNRPQAGRTAKDDKWAGKPIWNDGVLLLRYL